MNKKPLNKHNDINGVVPLRASGAGRVALVNRLIEIASISSATNSSSNNEIPESSDSGLEKLTTPSEISRGIGRGELFKKYLPSSCSSSLSGLTAKDEGISIETTSTSAMGRSKLLALYNKMTIEGKQTKITPIVNNEAKIEINKENIPNNKIEKVIPKIGTNGTQIQITTNYIRLKTDPTKGVYEYEVKFTPTIHSSQLRNRLINQNKEIIGDVKTFDGVTLYLPIKLPEQITKLIGQNVNNDNENIQIDVIFKRKKCLKDCTELYNVLFDRIMKKLNFVRFGRKRFDPTEPIIIPQHKLEIWPGYVTAVDEYDGGVMLCLDVSHRLLCKTTVLDLLRNVYQSDSRIENFQLNIRTALLGAVVITRYNNKCYRIDDINFDASPMDTFIMNDRKITYLEYYRQQYNIEIVDKKQPLLIHTEERQISGKLEKEFVTFCLIPEICNLTGLTDQMRSDVTVMRDIASITRVTPNQRINSYRKFCKNINQTPDIKSILTGWGLEIENKPEIINGRQFDEEQILFGNCKINAGPTADFNRSATSNEILNAINLTNWLVIYTKMDQSLARTFIQLMERNSSPMGIHVSKPILRCLDMDKTDLYVNELRKSINSELQIVVIICPTSRDDRYAAIKKVCCSELPIPSQVINARTLKNEKKVRGIVQKIALQMNCKMGGSLWSIKIPFDNVMICGIDTYHDSKKSENSVSAFVASLNQTYTRWYSRAVIQKKKEEFINGLCVSIISALETYSKMNNNQLPDRIIIYRDGVGNGQLEMCREYEIPQIQNACKQINKNYKPQLTFIVVQKRINTRLFIQKGRDNYENPMPGLVVDTMVTRRNLYDFYLVSQCVRQGTVTPSHYIVVYDSANFSPDILQRLSYKLCFLYYNWPGTIGVPACCQYAHKLAYLVGQSIKRPTAECLGDKLFYL